MDKQEKIESLRKEIAELEKEIPLGSLCYFWNDSRKKHLSTLSAINGRHNLSYRDYSYNWYSVIEVANKEETPLPWVYCIGKPDFKYYVIAKYKSNRVGVSHNLNMFNWDRVEKHAIINLGEKDD